MRRILILTLLLVTTSIVALQLRGHSGHIMLEIGEWTIETSVSFAITATFVTFSLLLLLVRILLRFIHAPRDIGIWRNRQKTRRAQADLNRGMITLAEGNWKKAEKLLGQSAANSDNPLMHYLGAANAAQHQHSDERRDHYLKLAHQAAPNADFVIRLTQAEQQVAHQQYDDALDTLTHLRKQKPNHPKLLRLLAQTLTAQKQWSQLLGLTPVLRKRKSMGSDELAQLEHHGQIQLLTESAKSGNDDALQQQWKQFSRGDHKNPKLIYHYANLLNRQGDGSLSEKLLYKEIKRQWSDDLVSLYGVIQSDSTDQQIQNAEKWLKHHADSAALHLVLGRLYLKNEIWGQAEQHLKKSIEISPSHDAYQEMGIIRKTNGDPAGALEYYEKSSTFLPPQPLQTSQSRDDLLLTQEH
ncbi:MAG: hypothetical protein H8D24_05150 [Gammaproteobacteria bacterium]|uniref:HemY N-terminal domain-containing protein n=1 Tax=Candidatus Thiopontia autotrophica TaxID=2841688 RepID=A0A8J6NZX4_9GAMM|nr:hypothetical protein [Candidatus Thiopontia autotrophica]MBL6969351.1 hypothetical protein [Gammaproteobacteria bacterium]